VKNKKPVSNIATGYYCGERGLRTLCQ